MKSSSFDSELANEICERLSEGKSLLEICRDTHMPNVRSVYRWRRENDQFALDYARAREDQGDTNADEIADVRKQVANGELDPQAGRVVIDALKWEAGRRKPKVYGDSTMLKHANADGELIRTSFDASLLSPEERDMMRQLMLAAQQRMIAPPAEEGEYEEVNDEDSES